MKDNPIIQQSKDFFSSQEFIFLILILGLLGLSCSIIYQQWLFFAVITLFPILILTLFMAVKKPLISFLLYSIAISYFHAIYRYTRFENMSGILDLFLSLCILSVIVNAITHNYKLPWKQGLNAQLLIHLTWIFYCILAMLSPDVVLESFKTSRTLFITTPIFIYVSGVLLCNNKIFKPLIILLGIFTLSAFIKAFIQKNVGFDAAEERFLFVEEGWHTHILGSGVRYFSFFSDAGTFGSVMGVLTAFFSLICIRIHHWGYRFFCISIAFLATIGMFWSGTRGAIMIPMAALCLYTIVNKNFLTIIATLFLGIFIYCFFAFTYIGQGNQYIRRMRTAFRPTADASFNVRLENQKRFAHYLKNKPFGVGIGQVIVDTEQILKLDEDFIPTDSEYVEVWVENGIVGLIFYIILRILLLLRCCYIIMFKIQNKQLRFILAAMLCSVFGLWINGYVGLAPSFQINVFYVIIFLSCVLNGPYIDKQLSKNEIII